MHATHCDRTKHTEHIYELDIELTEIAYFSLQNIKLCFGM